MTVRATDELRYVLRCRTRRTSMCGAQQPSSQKLPSTLPQHCSSYKLTHALL